MCNKNRFQTVQHIFSTFTDKDNPITISQLHDKVTSGEELDSKLDTKTLSKDIKALINHGFKINETKGEHNRKLYYCNNFLFSFEELAAVIEAIKASGNISENNCKIFIEKLITLTSIHIRKKLMLMIFALASLYIYNLQHGWDIINNIIYNLV